MLKPQELSKLVKEKSSDLGFDLCGIAKADSLPDHEIRLKDWLSKGYHAGMGYMERNLDLRADPRLLVEGAKSVIVVCQNYFPSEKPTKTDSPIFSKYAYGKDYHKILKDSLYILFEEIKKHSDKAEGRVFVDSAPVLERAWAVEAGLGWFGKNSMLINKKSGSYFFLGTLITDIEFEYDTPHLNEYCGSCSICTKACPTGAITDNRTLDSSRCLSYLTIEKKGEFENQDAKLHGHVFGCDICQDVCPWNQKAEPTTEGLFDPLREIMEYSWDEWEKITEDEFNNIFRYSPVLRTGYKGFIRNLKLK